MMRTIEVFLVIIIITAAFIISSFFAVLPSPRQVSPLNLRRFALTTLQMLDADHDLSETVFKSEDDPAWGELQVALSACLPPNMVYNLTVYEIMYGSEEVTYQPVKSLSNSESGLGVYSEASSYSVASSDVRFIVTPEKIGGKSGKNVTLYILNCEDANGWWITGYTGQSLASDLYSLLSPYFETTILVNSTEQLGSLLNDIKITSLPEENITDAVVINTFGEAVPIPTEYCGDSTRYCYTLGEKANEFNWMWISIVGYPFHYVTNTETFWDKQNGWGIYGMVSTGPAGLNAFLQGIDKEHHGYKPNSTAIDCRPQVLVVRFSSDAFEWSNYYGIYPSSTQTAVRALSSSELSNYNLVLADGSCMFDPVGEWVAAATYNHWISGKIHGTFIPIGLTRIPDIRVTALALLMYYQPSIYKSEFGAAHTSRLIVLQLAQQGGV